MNQGGAEFQILALAKLFQDNGDEVEVFALTNYGFYKPFINRNNIKYSHLLNHQSIAKRIWLTSRMLRNSKPDIVISYLKIASQAAIFAKILSGGSFKLIVGERNSLIFPKYDLYYFNLLRFVNGITVNSIIKLNYIHNNFPFLLKKTFYLPNIIDTNIFVPSSRPEGNCYEICYIGRVAREKNVIFLIKAVKILLEKYSNINLNIYGDTRDPQYLLRIEKELEELTDKTKIRIFGKEKDVLPIYKNASLICLISDSEGFSNVLSEAMSCGVPVIASDIEENRFLVEDGINGFLVNQKSVQDIARGIEKFLQLNEKSREIMGQKNRQKAVSLFKKNKLYTEYRQMIDNIY